MRRHPEPSKSLLQFHSYKRHFPTAEGMALVGSGEQNLTPNLFLKKGGMGQA